MYRKENTQRNLTDVQARRHTEESDTCSRQGDTPWNLSNVQAKDTPGNLLMYRQGDTPKNLDNVQAKDTPGNLQMYRQRTHRGSD